MSSDRRSAGNEPYVVISADSHAGLPTELYRQYLEQKYWPAFDDFLAGRPQALDEMRQSGVSDEQFAKQWFEEHAEGLEGGWDAERRDKEMDADGISAEVIFPDADAVESGTCAPFGTGLGLSGDHDPELGLAGRPSPQPVAGRDVRRGARAPTGRRPRPDHRSGSTTCSKRSGGPTSPVCRPS